MLQLYKNIRNKRIQLNMTQSQLAELMGYADKSMIAKIEKGNIDLPQSKIIAFANALHTTPGELMGWEEKTQTINTNIEINEALGVTLQKFRKQNNLNLKEVSKIIDKPLKTIQKYENGESRINSDMLEILADIYKTTKEEILKETQSLIADPKEIDLFQMHPELLNIQNILKENKNMRKLVLQAEKLSEKELDNLLDYVNFVMLKARDDNNGKH